MVARDRRNALMFLAGTVLSAAARATATPSGSGAGKDLIDRYYRAWQNKDLPAILSCVHEEVFFKSPNAASHGKAAYAAATQSFLPLVQSLELRRQFVDQTGALCALDFQCIAPIGRCPTAERLEFKAGLIVEDELFFDPRPFEAFARARAHVPPT